MQQKKQFKPQNLRAVLTALLILIVLGGGALFYWGIGVVSEYAVEVNHRIVDANASGKQIEQLQSLKAQLNQSNSLVAKANQIFSTPDTYRAQVQTDVKRYADAAGLSITSTEFSDPASTGAYTMTLTLRSPASYRGLITFLSNIETSLPKLLVSSITLGPPANGGANNVKVGEIKIDVAVR